MENYLLYFLKFNGYIIALILTHNFLFRKFKNFNFSRVYLLFGIVIASLLPLFNLSSWNQFGAQVSIDNLLQEIVISGTATPAENGFNWFSMLLYAYSVGAAFFFLRFILKLKRLFYLKAQTIQQESYFIIPNSTAAFSFMNWIFIGELLPSEDREIVLLHEKIHVAKRHSIDLLICQILEIIFWINPLIFKLKHQFDEVHEYEADELSCHHEEEYLHLLLKQNFNHYSFIPIHQFNSTHLKQRIMRIKNQSSRKINSKSIAVSVAAFGALFFINQNLNSTETPFFEANQITISSSVIGEVDKKAQFPGGKKALLDYFMENTKYPKNLIDENITDKIFVEFKVGKDGSISEVKLKNKGHAELEKIALEAVKSMPNWIPAEKDGKKVASIMTLPFNFLPPPPAPPAPQAPPKPMKAPASGFIPNYGFSQDNNC